MLVYIIDGFNVVHKIPQVKRSATPRKDLIHYIKKNRLTGSKNNKVIIVFDGGFHDLGEKEFEVVFSGEASADELIKKRLDKIKIKSEVIVVSDDKQIREFTIKARARSHRVQAFLEPKTKSEKKEETKNISYPLQREITEQMRKIWLKDE